MADISDLNASQAIKIAGAGTTGVETGFVDVSLDTRGNYRLRQEVSFVDSDPLDAYKRLRTSQPQTIYDTAFTYDKAPITWVESTTSGGTATHNTNTASVDLAVTTTTNSDVTFQSREYIKYDLGKSQSIYISANLTSTATNVIKRIGLYDTNNGLFFELSSSTLSVVRRTNTSGTPTDNVTNQSSWNIDKLDGTGASGLTLDITKQQIFIIDFKWLGCGRIRFGFFLNGKIYYCHEISTENTLTTPWSQKASLPIRAMIRNTGATASTMSITAVSVVAEGMQSLIGQQRTISTGITPRSVSSAGTVTPLISLRKQTAYVDIPVRILDASIFGDSSDDFLISIVYNPTTLTGVSWTNVSGFCQQDVSATALTGGTYLYSFYLRSNGAIASNPLVDVYRNTINLTLGRDVAGNSDIVSIVATNITSNATIFAGINYRELV